MHEPMPHHFVFSFEALAAGAAVAVFGALAAGLGAKVGAVGGVFFGVGALFVVSMGRERENRWERGGGIEGRDAGGGVLDGWEVLERH